MTTADHAADFPRAQAVAGVLGLQPYLPGKPVEELQRELGLRDVVKLASNENPRGSGALARTAAARALAELTRYPDGNGFALKQALAAHHDIAPACITLGNGSNDVLDMIARTFLSPATEAVFSEHAFAVYPIATQAAGAQARIVAATDGVNGPLLGHDLDAMVAAISPATRVVFVANPNNPTGTYSSEQSLRRFIEALPANVVVVVDEAYIEYVAAVDYPDASRWLDDFPNLVVTRTFSKVYGLAALRVGYCLSHPDIADLLNRVRQPFNVNAVALAAAQAALGDRDYVAASVQENQAGLNAVSAGLQKLEVAVVPSVGNFVLAGFGRPAMPVYEALLRAGVIVRPVANYGLDEYLRVTIGTPAENQRFLAALAQVLGEQADTR